MSVNFDLTGFNTADAYPVHGIHVHTNPIDESGCGSGGGHFNPAGVVHGAADAEVR